MSVFRRSWIHGSFLGAAGVALAACAGVDDKMQTDVFYPAEEGVQPNDDAFSWLGQVVHGSNECIAFIVDVPAGYVLQGGGTLLTTSAHCLLQDKDNIAAGPITFSYEHFGVSNTVPVDDVYSYRAGSINKTADTGDDIAIMRTDLDLDAELGSGARLLSGETLRHSPGEDVSLTRVSLVRKEKGFEPLSVKCSGEFMKHAGHEDKPGLKHDCPSEGGMSGSPLIVEANTSFQPVVAGVLSSTQKQKWDFGLFQFSVSGEYAATLPDYESVPFLKKKSGAPGLPQS